MVPQSWLSESAEKHYFIPKTLPQDVIRANVERSIYRLSEEAAGSQDDHRGFLQTEQSLLQMWLRQRSATSCEWLFNLQAYRKWANEAENPLLWLKGRPGAGKSMLCSAIIENLQQRQEQRCAVAFCFFDSRQGQVSSARYMLKAFAYQLRGCMRSIVLERLLRSVIRESEKLTDPMSLEQFQRKLRGLIVSVNTHVQVFLILDGLDDDESIEKVIMHEILRANRSREKSHIFRCLISSRSRCEARIGPEDIIQIDLSAEPGLQQDMLSFARIRLANIFRTSTKKTVHTLALAKQLCSRANGTFLWLALAIEQIQRTKSHLNLPQLVNSLPASIDAFYQRALQQIPLQDVETAQKIFSWLTVASRPLCLPELLEALSIKADQSQLPEQPPLAGNELSLPNSQAEIYRICGWLVTITEERIVRLRHPTLRDYLLFADESSNHPRHLVLAAHERLARACLVLLSSLLRAESSSALTNIETAQQLCGGMTSTLTRYAAANWSVHYRLSETYSRVLAGTLQRCLIIRLDYDCQCFSIPNSGRSIQIAHTTLRISASYGLMSLTQLCLEMGVDPKGGSCVLCETPLAIAVGGGHSEAANIILRGAAHSASRASYNSEEMIHLAVARGLTDAVQSLLECGSSVDVVEIDSGKTLLHVAAESGRLDLVKLLMGYNTNVNAVIPKTHETPLHIAAVHGYIHVVKYLVDGRDPSMRELELYDSIVQQPYYQSWTKDLVTNEGKTDSMVWDIDTRDSVEAHIGRLWSCSTRYSDINLRTSEGITALDLAASNGYSDIVRFLLERGADFKSEGSTRCIALQAALENGHLETVKLLLAAGANMHEQTDGLAPTLQHVYKKGHDDVADFVAWYCFIAEISAKQFPWPVLCLPTKTTNTVVRDAIQKAKLHTKFSKLGTHTQFAQRLGKLAERPKGPFGASFA
ncbi:hypothetical protein HO173_011603 [Letharia columbiana]|uniref:NACHT domain-containing protein n=1 Tax=Letharia columbiana TaxID=112416 RepID=A0A8H6FHU9_9LECA|nr:uncharacterized protein HO173_011603 [Letharia columbiana]KAF6228756.1 hypothetical protein HO173_011603 [Letharia columbiana]